MFGAKAIHQQLDTLEALIKNPRGSIGVLQDYCEFEKRLGIPGVIDFLRADPRAFELPPVIEFKGRTYSHELFRRRSRAVHSFLESAHTFLSFVRPEVAYVTATVRGPGYYQGFREKGLVEFQWADEVFVLAPDGHPMHTEYEPELFSSVVQSMRGPFDYGLYGAFVLAIPVSDMERYFAIPSGHAHAMFLLDGRVRIPAEHVIDFFGAPTKTETDMIEALLRCYWAQLLEFGYEASRKTWEGPLTKKPDPYTDPIPEVLVTQQVGLPSEIGLGGVWDARSFLEGWHRLAKINRAIAHHRASLRPDAFLSPTVENANRIQLI